MISGFVNTGNQQLHYLQWGSGKKLLLAFHGYSNQAGMFEVLAGRVAGDYTTVSLELPFHGKSEWNSRQPWTKQELMLTVQQLMLQFEVEKVSIVGFSLGGRISLVLAEIMGQLIDRMVLIAADGLVPNRFYRFVTANPAGKRMFNHFLDKPEGWMRFFEWLQERKMLHPSKRKFVEQYVALNPARTFLKKVWPNLHLLVPNQQKVRRNIEQYGIVTHLFMGRHDQVIPLAHGLRFADGSPYIHLHILEKGHRVMDEGTIEVIAQSLLLS